MKVQDVSCRPKPELSLINFDGNHNQVKHGGYDLGPLKDMILSFKKREGHDFENGHIAVMRPNACHFKGNKICHPTQMCVSVKFHLKVILLFQSLKQV